MSEEWSYLAYVAFCIVVLCAIGAWRYYRKGNDGNER